MRSAAASLTEMDQARGTWRCHASLAAHTTWRVGGPADRLYLPADTDDLAVFLRTLPPQEPLFWMGLGSNLLVRDGGIRGTVVCTRSRLKSFSIQGNRVTVEAGLPSPLVARQCADAGLTGAEFLAGIPGTFGGALAMNAGAFGGETWELVDAVTTIDRKGEIRWRSPTEFSIGYRRVEGPGNEWFLSATLRLTPGDSDTSRATIRELLARRATTQPANQPSCGSVFRNPPNDFAGRLIESCGLKGHRIGGARVSERHANFIVNDGGASASDIELLMEHVRTTVRVRCGILLEQEVRVVGDALHD